MNTVKVPLLVMMIATSNGCGFVDSMIGNNNSKEDKAVITLCYYGEISFDPPIEFWVVDNGRVPSLWLASPKGGLSSHQVSSLPNQIVTDLKPSETLSAYSIDKRVHRIKVTDPNCTKQYAATINLTNYSTDRNRVYWREDEIDADLGSFEVLGDTVVAKDKTRVFCNGRLLKNADTESIKIIERNFFENGNLIFHECHEIEEADRSTFTTLSRYYSKDVNSAYFRNKLIEGNVDTETFEAITDELLIDESYAKDKNQVYYQENVVLNADPNSFSILDFDEGLTNELLFKDINGVYLDGIKISDDPTSFTIITGSTCIFWKDSKTVFYLKEVVSPVDFSIDSPSFEYLGYLEQTAPGLQVCYGRDKSNTYSFQLWSDYSDNASRVNVQIIDASSVPKFLKK